MCTTAGAAASSRKFFPLSPQAAAIFDPLKVTRKGITFRCLLGFPGATLAADGAKCRRYRAPVFELARFGGAQAVAGGM